jgi:hypothetical protein
MICNETEDGWEIIFQRAHALLTANLLHPLASRLRPGPWTAILHAAAQHDHGWQEWEPGGRLTSGGAPQHFTDVRLEDVASQSRPLLRRLWHQDRWVALLVARHLAHLYDGRRGEEAALDAFLDEQADWRRDWRTALGLSEADEDRLYAPLRWADAFSLALCCRQFEDDGTVTLMPGPAGEVTTVAALTDREAPAVTVRPWPYREDRFTVSLDVYSLSRQTFDGHEALLEALAASPAVRRSWSIEAPSQ